MKLLETLEFKFPKLTGQEDGFRMRFPFLHSGIQNANKRTYSLAIVKKAIGELKAKLSRRGTFGSTSHPKEFEVDDVSHVIEDVSVDDKGTAWADVKILPTTKGRNLMAILKGGGRLGVSARGTGDVKDGLVQDGYSLHGVDFVTDPSFDIRVGAEAMFESRSEETDTDPNAEALSKAKSYKTVDELMEAQTQDEETALRLKYNMALQSGYQGSETEYRAIVDRKPEDRQAEIRFAAAREAGYRGSFEQFSKDLLTK